MAVFGWPLKTGRGSRPGISLTTPDTTTTGLTTTRVPTTGTIKAIRTEVPRERAIVANPRGSAQVLRPASEESPGAGRLPLFADFWRKVTTNNFVLNIVQFGLKIQFHTFPPMLSLPAGSFSASRTLSVSTEVSTLFSKSAITSVSPSSDQFVSPIFDVPKKDCDNRRVILNLKILNSYILKTSFRLEGIDTIINMLRPGDYFISIDLRDAYIMLLIHPDFWKYLCFDWEGKRFFYRCMPFGMTSSPRIFTKVFKRVLVFLRGRGLRISAWFDDIILIASSVDLLLEHMHFTLLTLKSLGFLPHPEKSMLTPSQFIFHLGFDWDTVNFTLSVPLAKVTALKSLCSCARSRSVTLRFLSQILGTVESFRVAFPYAALRYRGLQGDVACFVRDNVPWDEVVTITASANADLDWWLACPLSLPARSLAPFVPFLTVTTDSSESGWGAVSSSGEEVSGFWSEDEASFHINVLETKAVVFAFQSLFRSVSGVDILIRSDSTTTVSYINNFGGARSPVITDVIFQFYELCLVQNLRVRATHVCGRLNTRADALSRRPREHSYSLPSSLFSLLCDHFSILPYVDLFASRINNKLPVYFSEGPDPFASEFDAFIRPWPDSVYAFPPINMVDKFLSRFLLLNVNYGLLVCPYWPSQPYFSALLDLLIDDPVLISASMVVDAYLLPHSVSEFLVCVISSSSVLRKEFLQRLQPVSCEASTLGPSVLTYEAGSSLSIGVLHGRLISAHCL